MSSLPTVIVAGHICLDIIPDLRHLMPGQFEKMYQPGHLVNVGPPVFCTGGPVSNTGLALHKLGMPTRLMGKIGNDHLGEIVYSLVQGYGEDLARGMIIDQRATTSYTVIVNPPGVDRIFLHHPGANDTFCAADIDYAKLHEAALFHFGYPPLMRQMYTADGSELAQIYQRARATHVITSLDMAFPDPAHPSGQVDWRAIFKATLPYVDIFLPSIEELLMALHRPLYQKLSEQADHEFLALITPQMLSEISDELMDMGVKIVVIKLGERGLYLKTAPAHAFEAVPWRFGIPGKQWGDLEYWAPCFKVAVAGTTGAGDSTIAGFLSGLLRGLLPEDTITFALAAGACNVEAVDALSGLRSWDETQLRIAQGWERHPLQISAPEWHWNSSKNLWFRSRG